MTISGYKVFNICPHFATEPTIQPSMMTTETKLSPAPAFREFVGRHPQATQNFTFLEQSAAGIEGVLEFFTEMRGSWGAFFMPTWHGDLVASASLMTGENELSIEPVGYAANYFAVNDPVTWLGNHIFLMNEAGDFFASQVTAVNGSSPEILTLADNAPADFELGRFIVGFLIWSRFTSDEIDSSFNGEGQMELQLSTVQLIAYEGNADV